MPIDIEHVQNYVAKRSVGASTLRRMGPAKMVEKSREYLKILDLKKFGECDNTEDFEKLLNLCTTKMRVKFPVGGQKWGPARKVLNIFLLHSVYDLCLSTEYELRRIKPWLEVPLDKKTLTRIKGACKDDGNMDLPGIPKVIDLKWQISRCFQRAATVVANKKNCDRCDLDLVFWP